VSHVSTTVPGVEHSDSPVGHETFWREGQLLVAEQAVARLGQRVTLEGREFDQAGGVRRYRSLDGTDVERVMDSAAGDPELQPYVSVNHLFAAQHRPPYYDHPHETYHFANFGPPMPALAGPPPEADPTPAVTVGLLLRGRVSTVPALVPEVIATTSDAVGHADLVSGVIIAQAPGVQIMVAPVMDPGGMAEEFQIIRALTTPDIQRCQVLVLAFAGYTANDVPPPMLAMVLARPRGNQVVTAAAGNGGKSRPRRPAALPGVVAVGALDGPARACWPYSDRGPWVDLWAPGVDVVTMYRDWDSAVWSGTSAAVAHVAGRVATLVAHGQIPQAAMARLMNGNAGRNDPAGYP
jgi:hypothetical protein